MPSERQGGGRSRFAILAGVIAASAVVPVLWGLNRLVPAPKTLGAADGRLSACPDSPNCVNSRAEDGGHAIEPLRFNDTVEAAVERLHRVVSGMRGARLVRRDGGYAHYEFRTLICGFIDDVEFLVDGREQRIHVRSASRIGYSDLGANRRRIEEIRGRWQA
ncbi:MAG: DUF1499 domain-containing protein [Verrucomicrobiales bacterium]|nr:DUF1499 domain-containing protein [Verrucomicrobiales bacterium]